MQSAGYSWSEMAYYLKVGRTTAKRLARVYQKENESQIDRASKNKVQKADDGEHNVEDDQCPDLTIDEEFSEYLPKTFKVFVSLVKRARETQ